MLNTKKSLLKSVLMVSMLLVSSNLPASAMQPKSNTTRSANINASPTKIAALIIKQDDLTFQYLNCRRGADPNGYDVMSCHFKITYIGNDEMRNFSITSARVFSSLDGNQYNADTMTVGGNYSIDLISRQPIRGVISFPWNPGLRRLSVLQFETNNTSRKIQVKFRYKR
jgi:hypothetical protein